MGFEPTVRAYTRLAIWSFKPLSHLSFLVPGFTSSSPFRLEVTQGPFVVSRDEIRKVALTSKNNWGV